MPFPSSVQNFQEVHHITSSQKTLCIISSHLKENKIPVQKKIHTPHHPLFFTMEQRTGSIWYVFLTSVYMNTRIYMYTNPLQEIVLNLKKFNKFKKKIL